jgi:hypothetical protein
VKPVGRTKSVYDTLGFVAKPKNCTVSFEDSDGIRHSVEVVRTKPPYLR